MYCASSYSHGVGAEETGQRSRPVTNGKCSAILDVGTGLAAVISIVCS